jgi:uncharacterized protein (TIGR00369 family)
MTDVPSRQTIDGAPTYMGSGDPARRRNDYYPWWLDNLADDITLEASAMVGAAQGPEAVRSIVVAAFWCACSPRWSLPRCWPTTSSTGPSAPRSPSWLRFVTGSSAKRPHSERLELPFREELTQQHGVLHAGAVATIVDSACEYAALTLMPDGAAVLTAEYKVNLVAPAAGEFVVARARVLKAGRTLTVARGDAFAVHDGQEKLVATMLATLMTVQERGIEG